MLTAARDEIYNTFPHPPPSSSSSTTRSTPLASSSRFPPYTSAPLVPHASSTMKLSILVAGLLTAGFTFALPRDSEHAVRPSSLSKCLDKKNVPAKWHSSPEYADLAEPFNLRLQYKPAVIVLPKTSQHVQDAVVCASECGFKVSKVFHSPLTSYLSIITTWTSTDVIFRFKPRVVATPTLHSAPAVVTDR